MNDRPNEFRTNVNAQNREQITGDDRSQNSDDNVADQTETRALNDETRDPAGNRSDNEPNKQCPHSLLLNWLFTETSCQGSERVESGLPAPLLLPRAGIEDPGCVAEGDIETFLAQGRSEFDGEFVEHGLDLLIR